MTYSFDDKEAVRALWPRENSFLTDIWDEKDVNFFRRNYDKFQKEDENFLNKFGKRLVSDAFFCLTGAKPNQDDPLGVVWDRMQNSAEVESMKIGLDKNQNKMAVACVSLATSTHQLLIQEGVEEARKDTPQGKNENLLTAIREAEKTADQTSIVIEGVLPSISPEMPPKKRFDTALEIATMFDVKKFAQLFGWAEQWAGIVTRPSVGDTGAKVGSKLDGWSANVDATEMLGVAQGDIQALIKLAEETLTTSVHQEEKETGPGPVIVMTDESSSMVNNYQKEHRFLVARMIEMALAKVFREQGRDLYAVGWSSEILKVDPTLVSGIDAGVVEYLHGEANLLEHLQICKRGGTKILPALEKTVRIADEWGENCDILILTDGNLLSRKDKLDEQIGLAKRIVEPFKKNGGRVWAVTFEVRSVESQLLLKNFCDGVVELAHLQGNDDFGGLIRSMAQDRFEENIRL